MGRDWRRWSVKSVGPSRAAEELSLCFFLNFFLSRVELVVVETTAGRPCLQLTVKEDVMGRLPLLVAGGIGCADVGGRDCTRSTLQTNGENN